LRLQQQARRVAAAQPAVWQPDAGKGRLEQPVERVLAGHRPNGAQPDAAGGNVANWQVLAEDTQDNESRRRLLIHERLLTAEAIRPDQIKKWLYKEVLNVDLDDPYLGLRNLLFANELFRDG
jgi:hypothetical protein